MSGFSAPAEPASSQATGTPQAALASVPIMAQRHVGGASALERRELAGVGVVEGGKGCVQL